MVAQAHTYDITLRFNGKSYPYLYGPKGGVNLGHALLEPSAPSRTDTIPIQSLHHGYGRKIATDPNMARDSNGETYYADVRQPGFVMPSGALELLDTFAIEEAADVEAINGYAAAYSLDNGDVVFGAGKQVFTIDHITEVVSDNYINTLSGYFSGSNFVWANDLWFGVQSISGISTGAYNYDTDSEDTTDTYMHSWAGSTRNAIFWIRNRSGGAPQLRWSDRTDQDFGAFNVNFIYPNATNAYILEIPKGLVTGAGVTGQYFLYANKGGNIWGLDRNEVFIPLTPDQSGAFNDAQFGGQMKYVGSWLLVPNLDGLGRFDPRNVSLTDITPAVHQGATPGIGTLNDKSIHFTSPTPTGAVVAGNLIDDDINILQLEMYEDGMFYHPAVQSLGGISHVWGIMVSRYYTGGSPDSRLKAYILASDTDYENWLIYKLDLATASWSPGPAAKASASGFRTGYYTTRPPDINASATQLRGFAQASDDNPIELNLLVDNDDSAVQLGILNTTGPFVLPVPEDVLPGRKFAVSGKLSVSDQNGTVPFLTLPLSIDYRYVEPAKSDGKVPDFITLKFMASSSQINKITSHLFTHGRTEVEVLLGLVGTQIEVGFSDSKTTWKAIVEDADSDQLTFEDGRTAPDYLMTLVCRRVS